MTDRKSNTGNTRIEVSAGNIFTDLEVPDAGTHLLKAELVLQLAKILKQKKLTQADAAKIIGIAQPDVSKILRGQFRGFSVERLMTMLTAFDRDVEIVVRRHKEDGRPGTVKVLAAE